MSIQQKTKKQKVTHEGTTTKNDQNISEQSNQINQLMENANLKMIDGHLSESFKLFEELRNLLQNSTIENNNVEELKWIVLCKLQFILSRQGKFDESIKLFSENQTLYFSQANKHTNMDISLFPWLTVVYCKCMLNHHQDANQLISQFLTIFSQELDSKQTNFEICILLMNLTLMDKKGKCVVGLETIEKVREILIQQEPQDQQQNQTETTKKQTRNIFEFAWYLLTLEANFLKKMCRFDECSTIVRRLKHSQKKIIEKTHYSYANTLVFVGMIEALTSKQTKNAEKYFNRALNIFETQFGKQSAFYRMAIYEFAGSLIDMEEVTKAKNLLDDYLSYLGNQKNGIQTREYAWTLNRIGNIFQFQDAHEKAKPFFEKCIEIEEKTIGTNCLEFAMSLDDLASMYREWEKTDLGIKTCEKIINLKKQLEETDASNYATTLWTYGLLLEEKDQFSKALSVFQECLKVQKNTTGDSQQWYFSTLTNIGFTQRKLNQFQKAIETYTELGKLVEQKFERTSDDFTRVVADVRYTTDSLLSTLNSLEKKRDAMLKVHMNEWYVPVIDLGTVWFVTQLCTNHALCGKPLSPSLTYDARFATELSEGVGRMSHGEFASVPMKLQFQRLYLSLSMFHKLIAPDVDLEVKLNDEKTTISANWTKLTPISWFEQSALIRLVRLLYSNSSSRLSDRQRSILICILHVLIPERPNGQKYVQRLMNFATKRETLKDGNMANKFIQHILNYKDKKHIEIYCRALRNFSSWSFPKQQPFSIPHYEWMCRKFPDFAPEQR